MMTLPLLQFCCRDFSIPVLQELQVAQYFPPKFLLIHLSYWEHLSQTHHEVFSFVCFKVLSHQLHWMVPGLNILREEDKHFPICFLTPFLAISILIMKIRYYIQIFSVLKDLSIGLLQLVLKWIHLGLQNFSYSNPGIPAVHTTEFIAFIVRTIVTPGLQQNF